MVEQGAQRAAVVEVVEQWVQWAAVVVMPALDGRSMSSIGFERAAVEVVAKSA